MDLKQEKKMTKQMNVKTKIALIFCIIAALLLTNINAARADAPGVSDPGKRVPARTTQTTAQKKARPVKKVTTRKITQPARPAPKPVAQVNYLNEAVALIKQEKYKKALPYILRAAEAQPKNADVWYWFGVWCDKTGNFASAQKYFTKALCIDPNYPALTRIVVYPDDPYGKNPLWDSVRPPSIEAIYSTGEITISEHYQPEYGDLAPETPVYQPPAP